MSFDKKDSGKILDSLANFFIYPEIKRRREQGLIDDTFDLIAAQLIQFPDGRKRIIRLNAEVKAIGKPIYKNGVVKKKGDPVYAHEIDDIEWIELTDEDEPDCSHATILKIGSTWYAVFDFRLNKALSKKFLLSAESFLDVAKVSLTKKNWAPFLDNLFSAAELAIRSTLLTFADPSFRKKTTHKEIKRRFNKWANVGNALPAEKDIFNKLIGYRARARYTEPDFSIPEDEAKEMFQVVAGMIQHAQSRLN